MEVMRCETALLPSQVTRGELGVHIQSIHSLSIPGQCPCRWPSGLSAQGDTDQEGTPKRKTEAQRWQMRAAWPPLWQATACWGSGRRAELTRARCGQSEAHNGTVPLGVSCQSAREHGTVAKGAVALHRRRERQDFKTFSPLSKSNFQRALKLNEFQSKSSQDRGLRGAPVITRP